MSKHLLVVGGGHAHMTVMKHLDRFISAGHRVTVVSLSAHHYYSGMGPGLLSGIYRPEEVRFNVKKMVEDRGGRFVADRVVRVDPTRRDAVLQSGEKLTYDVASFNTGSSVPAAGAAEPSENVFTVKPIESLLRARAKIGTALKEQKLQIVVAGGGPAGVEITGNLSRLTADLGGKADITLVAGPALLGGFSLRLKEAAESSLARRRIKVLTNAYADRYQAGALVLSDGSELPCDYLFYATGVKPSSLFADSGFPTGEDGGLLVNDHLQSVAYPEIFGGGDCICFKPRPLAKVGVYAVRQNPVLMHNLMAAMNHGRLRTFTPQRDYLLAFNMGDGTAILKWKGILINGRLGFKIKDYIDQRFMKAFQLSGERNGLG